MDQSEGQPNVLPRHVTSLRRAPSSRGSAGPQSFKLSSARASSSGEREGYIIALLHGRGTVTEVGICGVSLSTGKTFVTQLVDGLSYTRTIHHIHHLHPVVILSPVIEGDGDKLHGSRHSMLETLSEEFQVQTITVPRELWKQELGIYHVKRLAVNDEKRTSTLASISDKYYALCATGAAFEWLQLKDMIFAPQSLMIRYTALEGTLFIDAQTAKDLELVNNVLSNKTQYTLLGALDTCMTPMGSRLLRSNILQPFNDQNILGRRLDAIHELCKGTPTGDKLKSLRQALKPLHGIDLDNILAQFSQRESSENHQRDPEYQISLLVQLRTAVEGLEIVRDCLAGCRAPLLQSLRALLVNDILSRLKASLDGKLDDSPANRRTNRGLTAKGVRLFAIRDGVDKLLDVARIVYSDTRRDIQDMAESLCEHLPIQCEALWTKAGFRFCVKHGDEEVDLTFNVINVDRQRKQTLFATHELMVANNRLRASEQEIFTMSMKVVAELELEVGEASGSLYGCSEALGVVDVIGSLANACSIRPEYKDTMAIKSGRHIMLERRLSRDCVPNDVYATGEAAHFQLIQGPNMSGKSTYLKQVGLLAVQAMVGCHVPADYASIRLHDALLSRLSNEDSMEKSLSTFAAEMKSAATIIGLATPRSLVLIDELGRGTAPQEGIGLSHAIAERLVQTKAFVFFTTHFRDLSVTLHPLPGVVHLHLAVEQDEASAREFSSTFKYKVTEGRKRQEHYGLLLARLASLPDAVLQRATQVASAVNSIEATGKRLLTIDRSLPGRASSAANNVAIRRKCLLELRGTLKQIAYTSRLSDVELAVHLRQIEADTITTLSQALQVGNVRDTSSESNSRSRSSI